MITAEDIKPGDFVYYVPFEGCDTSSIEHGKVKSRTENGGAFVVYNCNEGWDRFENYTACNTNYRDLITEEMYEELVKNQEGTDSE